MAKQETVLPKSEVASNSEKVVDLPSNGVRSGFTPGRVFGKWAVNEGRLWQRAFNSPAPYALLLGLLVLFSLAWQVPFSYSLDAKGELNLDQPFLHNFNTIENTDARNKQGDWFRWSEGNGTVDFPGIGKHAYRFEITVANGLIPDAPYALYANDTKIAEGKLAAGKQTLSFDIPADAVPGKNGNLELTLKVEGVSPGVITPGSNDKRVLGFPFFSAKVTPAGNGPVVPPFTQLGWLIGAVILAYFIFARAGFAPWKAAGAAFALALIPAAIVASPGARPWLTIFSDKVALAFGWSLVFVVLADIPLRRVWQFGWERRWALAIFGLSLALRLTGVLHPQTETDPSNIVDLAFHLDRYAALWDRGLWWDRTLSYEWGGRLTYYPLATYLFMGPFNLLIPDRRLLMLLWTATFEASRALMMYYLVKKVTGQGRAAIIAALFMAILPVNMFSFAWGQIANLMGEWFILAALCLVAVKWDRLRHPWTFALLTLALLGSFLVHPGEVLVSGVVFLTIGVVLWLRRESRKQAAIMLAAFLLAVILAVACYHWVTIRDMVPEALQSVSNRLQGKDVTTSGPGEPALAFIVGGSVHDDRLGLFREGANNLSELVSGGLRGFWTEGRVYYDTIPQLFLPWGLGLLWWTSRKAKGRLEADPKIEAVREAKRRFFWIGLAWTGTAVVFALAGLLLNLYVRYSLFLLPLVAVCAGVFLNWLWTKTERLGRGWAGALLTAALCGWLAFGTLSLFLDRLIYYKHPIF